MGQIGITSFLTESQAGKPNSDSTDTETASATSVEEPVMSSGSSIATCSSSTSDSGSESSSSRRGVAACWRSFGESKWRKIYPWLLLKEDGIYCQYCSHSRHKFKSQTTYQVRQTRTATNSTVLNLVERSNVLTVDENAFCDAMCYMYFLNKHEMVHTTNFSCLRELCVLRTRPCLC